MISDYYCLDGTKDARCPQLGIPWCWNEWSPVTGENAWTTLIGILQAEYLKTGSLGGILPTSTAVQIALRELTPLLALEVAGIGGIHYAPYNMFSETNPNPGGSISTENTVSVLAGLRMLYTVVSNDPNGYAPNVLANINQLMLASTKFLKASYSPELGYFRQGGTYWVTNDTFVWADIFAADCQTWAISVLGLQVVDSWFGTGTTEAIWKTTKEIAGYNYDPQSGFVDGVGFSDNQQEQVFSGEWSYGAVNMLRIMAAYYNTVNEILASDKCRTQANHIATEITTQLTQTVNFVLHPGVPATSIKYSNKRYFIPFGWWANPIPSTASTGWAVMTDMNFNPFVLGGDLLPANNWNTNV